MKWVWDGWMLGRTQAGDIWRGRGVVRGRPSLARVEATTIDEVKAIYGTRSADARRLGVIGDRPDTTLTAVKDILKGWSKVRTSGSTAW